MDKARELPADCLVFDLEDAVAPAAKLEARRQVADTLGQGGYGTRELVVRVNAIETPWGSDDLVAITSMKPDGVLLPKVATCEQILAATSVLASAGNTDMPAWIMIETPAGVMNAGVLAASGQRLSCLVLGTSDLSKDLRLPSDKSRLGLLASLSSCVCAARAHGLDVLDGVHLDFGDAEGLKNSCVQGRQLGFDGKTLIHPSQIDIANQVFGPDEDEVAAAEEIIEAWRCAMNEGKGITVVRGRLVENLHVEHARRTLALRDAIRERQASR